MRIGKPFPLKCTIQPALQKTKWPMTLHVKSIFKCWNSSLHSIMVNVTQNLESKHTCSINQSMNNGLFKRYEMLASEKSIKYECKKLFFRFSPSCRFIETYLKVHVCVFLNELKVRKIFYGTNFEKVLIQNKIHKSFLSRNTVCIRI